MVDAGQNLGAAYELDINGVNQNSYGSGWEIGAHVYQGYAEYGAGVGSNRFIVGTTVNYYVSPTGSDSNSCLSSAAACLTIAHAESLSAAGDTINIAAGMYRLTSGTNGHYTSNGGQIAAKNGQTFVGPSCTPTSAPCSAILSGSVQLTSGQILGPDGDDNYYATGFTQQGNTYGYACDTGWAGCNYPEDLYVDGSPYQHMNLSSEASLSAGTWWFNYSTDTIYLPAALTPTFVSGNTVEIGVLNTVFSASTGASGVTVDNLTVEEFASQLGEGGGVDPNYGLASSATSATNWQVENSYLTLNHSAGLRVGFGMQALNDVITANGEFGIGGGLAPGSSITPSGLVVEGNTVTLNNYAHVSPGFGAGGIKFGNTADAVVRGNVVENNIGNGIHFDVNSVNPLIDGNTLSGNADTVAPGGAGNGIICEISELGCTIRNNLVSFAGTGGAFGIVSSTTSGSQAYCNVITEPSGVNNAAWEVLAANRGNNTVQPNLGAQIVSTGNYFHHNTVIWDTGTGSGGYAQFDTANQPNFFVNNTPPDYNSYHASSTSVTQFVYDNNNSGDNTLKTFANYQATGADVHGSLDTIYTSGFPAVAITSPADESSVANPVTIAASASDASGISKVEFYVDWTLQATVTTGPYNYNWAASAGTHTIAAMAFSNAGIQSCNAVTLNGPPS